MASLSLRTLFPELSLLPHTVRHVAAGGRARSKTNLTSLLYKSSNSLLEQLLNTTLPSISLQLPTLGSIWDSILKAVPKKKTSHSKRRSRLLAGKGLKDIISFKKCPGCGKPIRQHYLCPYCVAEIKDMWNGRGTKEIEEAKRAAKEEAMKGWQTVEERRAAGREPRR